MGSMGPDIWIAKGFNMKVWTDRTKTNKRLDENGLASFRWPGCHPGGSWIA